MNDWSRPRTLAGFTSYLVRSDESILATIDPQALARPMEFHPFLTLRVGREFLAVPLDRIQRLQAAVQMTPIPDRGIGLDGLADVGDGLRTFITLAETRISRAGLLKLANSGWEFPAD